MIRYSKPLGKTLEFKKDIFDINKNNIKQIEVSSKNYTKQPLRVNCKNCNNKLNISEANTFTNFKIKYTLCETCGHCNGIHDDTEEFCKSLYTEDEGVQYSKAYKSENADQYFKRVKEIYTPKAQFLKDALEEIGHKSNEINDFGAGAGYFITALKELNYKNIVGYEPSKTLSKIGNLMLENDYIKNHELSDIKQLVENSRADTISFIGVLEHLQNPREILESIQNNDHIKHIYISVPLFSPSVVFESIFQNVVPRHLTGGHTHLYTEQSIDYLCNEFNFDKSAEWWFGSDMTDLFRSVLISLEGSKNGSALHNYWNNSLHPLIDDLQSNLDKAKLCSEVHLLLSKKSS